LYTLRAETKIIGIPCSSPSFPSYDKYFRLCLRVWRGREWKERLKKKKQVEGVEKFGREGV
jgi:hypothetical protein